MFRRIAASTLLALTIAACGVVSDPIEVTSLNPEDGATGVPVDVQLEATFDRGIDETTLDGNFSLSGPGGDVAGTIGYVDAARTATFTPAADLDYATTYTATVSGSVATTDGDTLAGEASWSFTTEAEPEPEDAIGGLEVSPATETLTVGATAQLTATATGVVGSPDTSVAWSSDDTDVATVDAVTGLVTAVDAGTATITATSNFDATITATAEITVAPPLTGADYLLDTTAGTPIDPVLEADLAGGAAPFSFALSPTYEADPLLPINGLPPGTALDPVTGEISGTPTTANYYRASIEVTDAAGQTIKVLAEIDVELGFSYASDTYLYDPNLTGEVVAASEIELIGSTGPEIYSMALVSNDGTGVAADWAIDEASGAISRVTPSTPDTTTWTYTVTVIDDGGSKTATFDVTLTAFQIGGLDVTPEAATVTVGDTEPLTATATGVVGSPDTSVTWSSSDEGVATVDASGLVTAVSAGTATITATSDFDGTVSGSAEITVVDAIGGLDVTPETATVIAGDTEQLTATPTGVAGSPDTSVTWSSDDEAVATVDASGLVTAVTAGTAIITATSNFDGSVSDSAEITVVDGPL